MGIGVVTLILEVKYYKGSPALSGPGRRSFIGPAQVADSVFSAKFRPSISVDGVLSL